jgi:hypothetical protein
MNEADTCRTYILPNRRLSEWLAGEGQRVAGVTVRYGEELSALRLSILDKAFKDEL